MTAPARLAADPMALQLRVENAVSFLTGSGAIDPQPKE